MWRKLFFATIYCGTARKAMTAFNPPNAKEFESAAPTRWVRGLFGM
jgi:hypothetical protein